MTYEKVEPTALVNIGDIGVEWFPAEAVGIDDDGVARNLTPGTEYVVLTPEESEAYWNGDVQLGLSEVHEAKFTVLFPGLDTFKVSVAAHRSEQA